MDRLHLGPRLSGAKEVPPAAGRSQKKAATSPRDLIQTKSAEGAMAPSKKRDIELTTRLTRCKYPEGETAAEGAKRQRRKRTLTTLEQALEAQQAEKLPAGPVPCRFKAQVAFESDTDSAAERHTRSSRLTSSSGHNRLLLGKKSQKELLTETKFESTRAKQNLNTLGALQPNWDYSLKVNRMRNNKIDSRVK